MDCLKYVYYPSEGVSNPTHGVFHSSREQSGSGYNALYYAQPQGDSWTKIAKLSSRGSQGYIQVIELPQTAYLVLYELENHEKGNTIAIRLYQDW